MYSIFWKTLFSGLMIFFIFSNLAFTFDIVGDVNMTPVSLAVGDTWSNYYFGVSSFIDAFKTWFGDNSALSGFSKFVAKMGDWIGRTMSMYTNGLSFGKISTTGNILKVVVNIILWTNSIIPMIVGTGYIVIFLIYILFIVFQIAAFVIYWFGGGFMTRLPSSDWYNSYSQYGYDWSDILDFWKNVFQTSAIMV